MPPFTVLYRRGDGSFVIDRAGVPYHVTQSDPLHAVVAAVAEGMELPDEPAVSLPLATLPQAPGPRLIAKTTIYRRCTDAELATLEATLPQLPARQRLMWHDAEGGLVVVDEVQPLFEAAVGEERAAELLAE